MYKNDRNFPFYPAISGENVGGNHWMIKFDHDMIDEINFEVEFRYPGEMFPDPGLLCLQTCPETVAKEVELTIQARK